MFVNATAASGTGPTCPRNSVSVRPINIWPNWPAMIGDARRRVGPSCATKVRPDIGTNRQAPNQVAGNCFPLEAVAGDLSIQHSVVSISRLGRRGRLDI